MVTGKFADLLIEFNALWEKSPADKQKFEALKEKAKLSSLNSRQSEAIIARCNNVLAGTYGKTKSAEHYGHEKPSK